MTQVRIDGTDALAPGGFTRADMQRLAFSHRQYAGELTRDALVARPGTYITGRLGGPRRRRARRPGT